MNNIEEITKDCIRWIKDWFENNGNDCNAVIGISGGKDSTVVAKLCCEALGKDRVIGVLMPCGEQKDINDSKEVCELLGIKNYTFNIGDMFTDAIKQLNTIGVNISQQTMTNLPPRLRMATLYAISQSNNGRVLNTCNLSEETVGYSTRFGDSVGDLSPLGELTVSEIIEIGDYLGLPHHLVHKTPIDGLNTNEDGSYVTDEDKLGVSYADIDAYINRTLQDKEKFALIEEKERKNRFKREPIPTFSPKKMC